MAVSGSMAPGWCIRSSCWRNVPSFDDVGVMGEGGACRHHGRGLHSGPWPLLSVGGIVAVSGSMVPGGRIRSSCWRNVPSFDDVGVMGEGGEGQHSGHGLHAGPWPLPSVGGIVAVLGGVMVPGGCIRSACLWSVPDVDKMARHGESEDGDHRGYGFRR